MLFFSGAEAAGWGCDSVCVCVGGGLGGVGERIGSLQLWSM